jgi:glycosyltransferase involved in cell wall biosynthesis
MKASGRFAIIVGDNDSEMREGISVCEALQGEGFPVPLECVVVSERGISFARNALISAAIERPEVRLIAMIDDDEWASPNWLDNLIRVQAATNADIVGGPVGRVFETPVPAYLESANIPEFDRIGSGPIEFIDATSNILFKAKLFREGEGPWFDPYFALMGGEDKDLLLSFKLAGKRFAWASDAIVIEELPASRCSVSWMLKRAFWIGSTDMLISLKRRPPGFNVVSETAKISGAAVVSFIDAVLFVWNPPRRFAGLRLGARVAGKLSALIGFRHKEYSVTHGR